MIKITHKGSFNKVQKFMNRMKRAEHLNILSKYGELGVDALSSATPIDSGETASKWSFEIERTAGTTTIYWTNDSENDGVNIAVILQYGHGTGTGGYVEGIDYINPALKPVFQKIADELWKEVKR